MTLTKNLENLGELLRDTLVAETKKGLHPPGLVSECLLGMIIN